MPPRKNQATPPLEWPSIRAARGSDYAPDGFVDNCSSPRRPQRTALAESRNPAATPSSGPSAHDISRAGNDFMKAGIGLGIPAVSTVGGLAPTFGSAEWGKFERTPTSSHACRCVAVPHSGSTEERIALGHAFPRQAWTRKGSWPGHVQHDGAVVDFRESNG